MSLFDWSRDERKAAIRNMAIGRRVLHMPRLNV